MTSAEMVVVGMKHIVCFSGGHSSAIAAVEVVRKFGAEDAILLNHDLCPRTEDADIKRFKKQVSDYLGVPITYANMPGWDVKDQFDVCMEIKAFKAGAQSTAFCTNRLKTEPFHKWLSEHYPANPPEVRDDISLVYGFDANEQHRIRRRVGIMAAMGYQTEYPLTWEVRTIHDIEEVGIERPKTYSIFNHANCTGCLKAGKQHWFVVYCLYPKIWEKAKLAEDTIGYSILKQGYLSDFEAEFAKLKEKALPPTEKAKPQTFWSLRLVKGISVRYFWNIIPTVKLFLLIWFREMIDSDVVLLAGWISSLRTIPKNSTTSSRTLRSLWRKSSLRKLWRYPLAR